MKNYAKKKQIIGGFDGKIAIVVIHSRKHIAYSANRHPSASLCRWRDIQGRDGYDFFQTAE